MATSAPTLPSKELRIRYPWFARPSIGRHHCVIFGDVCRANGIHYGDVKGYSLDVLDQYQEPGLEPGDSAMLVFADGRVLDIFTGSGYSRNPRSQKAELWEPEPKPYIRHSLGPKGLIEAIFYP